MTAIQIVPPFRAKRESDVAVTESVYTKIAWRIVPILMLCYVCAYLDRVNIGFAKLQMMKELRLNDAAFGLGAGIFFLGYMLCGVPSNILLYRLGARRWITAILLVWGILSGTSAFVHTEAQFYVIRFLLGVSEAGLAPGILLYLTYWFSSGHRARMTNLWFVAIPLSGIIGGPLSGLIMQHFAGLGGWDGWRWMFIVEAAPTIATGFIVATALKDRVEDVTWLNENERAYVLRQLRAEDLAKVQHVSAFAFLRDWRIWILASIYFSIVVGQYAVTFWLPTMIRATGMSEPSTIGAISAIPYVFAVFVMILAGRSSDRTKKRRLHVVLPVVIGATALSVATLFGTNAAVSIVSLCLAAAGILTASSTFWMLPTNILAGLTAAAGIGVVNSIANIGGFVSPYLIGWVTVHTGSDALGMYAITLLLVVGAFLTLKIPSSSVDR